MNLGKILFVAHNQQENCCGNDSFWKPQLEVVNKDPSFPKVPRSRGKPNSGEYQALHNIARKLRPIIRANFVDGITAFQDNINLYDLAEAISESDSTKAMNLVPWDNFRGAIKDLEDTTLQGISESAEKSKFLFRKSINSLVPTLQSDIVFDANNPGVRNWIDNHLGELIQNVKTTTQKAVQNIIATGINAGLPPSQSAKLISQIVGLNDRQAMAVINRRMALQKQGVKGPKLEAAVKAYAQKQLEYRGEMIARTESMSTNNRGMLEVVNQNAEAGLFNRNKAMKEWIVTPYDRLCSTCGPMAGKKVPLDSEFKLRNGKSVKLPPAHPNCNCGWALVLPDDAVI